MRKMWVVAAMLAGLSAGRLSAAVAAGAVKSADDRAANWLIEKYDHKTNQFKCEAPDLQRYAILVTAFCRHPHDYKEVSGPWVTGPVKYILSQVKEDGSVATPGSDEWQTLAWVLTALKSTENEKYEPLVAKLRDKMNAVAGGKDMHAKWKTEEFSVAADPESLRKQVGHAQELEKAGNKEKCAELAENVLKLQQPNGSFGDNIEVNALAIQVLNHCYKAMK
jgi:hypothetical protein